MRPAPDASPGDRPEPTGSIARRLIDCRPDAVATARALAGRQDAEDIAQEAMLRVLTAVKRGARVEDPRAYLRAVVRNVVADRIRAGRGEALMADVPERGSRHQDPHQVTELREVLSAIDELGPAQRDALVGTVLTPHDQRDLATWLHTSPAGVRQLVRRARLRLRETIGAWVPWGAGRITDLLSVGAGARGQVLAVAAAAIVVPVAPTPPVAPKPPEPALSATAIAVPVPTMRPRPIQPQP